METHRHFSLYRRIHEVATAIQLGHRELIMAGFMYDYTKPNESTAILTLNISSQ